MSDPEHAQEVAHLPDQPRDPDDHEAHSEVSGGLASRVLLDRVHATATKAYRSPLVVKVHAIASSFPLLAAGIVFLIISQAADLFASEETALAGVESSTGVIGAGFLLTGLSREASRQCGASFLPIRSRP